MYTRAPWAQQPPPPRSSSSPAAAAGMTTMPPPPPPRQHSAGAQQQTRAGGMMTMRPRAQMGPPPAPMADQTTSGFAFVETTWNSYFDQRHTLSLATVSSGGGGGSSRGSSSGAMVNADDQENHGGVNLQVYTAGALPPRKDEDHSKASPVYVLLHGGGLSSLSWALVAGALKRHGRLTLAYDFRAHGGSTGEESALTADLLCADTIAVIEAMAGKEVPLVIVGHSLGGAIAAKVSCKPELRERVIAIAMIDIVESVAMSSLHQMEQMIARRPSSFRTPQEAIHWAVTTGMVGNPVSAAVSIPSLLRQHEPETTGTSQIIDADELRLTWRTDLRATTPLWPVCSLFRPSVLSPRRCLFHQRGAPNTPSHTVTYLMEVSTVVQDWFEGMDWAFLSCGIPSSVSVKGAAKITRRLLLLNSLDSLGKELTVAQMQGKIQVEPLPGRGHHLHEEEPHKVVEMLLALG